MPMPATEASLSRRSAAAGAEVEAEAVAAVALLLSRLGARALPSTSPLLWPRLSELREPCAGAGEVIEGQEEASEAPRGVPAPPPLAVDDTDMRRTGVSDDALASVASPPLPLAAAAGFGPIDCCLS